MIELTFIQYLEKLGEEKLIIIPTEHIYEDLDYFAFIFKSREKWEYYTIITKESILEFANQSEEAIEDFKLNYCYNCLPIKDVPFYLPYIPLEGDTPIGDSPTQIYIETMHKNILDGEDIVEESETYEQFLMRLFNTFEKRVLAAVSKIDKSYKSQKNFGEFLSNLFNTVNTVAFSTKIRGILKASLDEGRVSAEKELKTDIPYNEAYEDALKILYSQQIDGYTINGKKWFGIKGVTKQIQQKVIKTVQDGINENKTTNEISSDIKSTFSNFSDWRAQNIARTETTRILAEGKLIGYKESGIEGNLVWITAPFEKGRSSEICQRLHNQEVPLDNPFIDPETHKAFTTPPAHPNCRSTIIFRPK